MADGKGGFYYWNLMTDEQQAERPEGFETDDESEDEEPAAVAGAGPAPADGSGSGSDDY